MLEKELRTRLRARRQPAPTKVGAVTAGVIVLLSLYGFAGRELLRGTEQTAADLYGTLVIGMGVTLVLLLAPSLAAGAITREREQQTWNALLLSRLTAGQIVAGKFVAALLPSALLLGALFPIGAAAAARAHLPAGVFALSQATLGATAVFFTASSLLCSWAFRRTYVATAAAFSWLAAAVVGTYVLYFLGTLAAGFGSGIREEAFLPVWLNPYRALAWASDPAADHVGQAGFYLLACAVGTAVCLAVVTRRLGRGPKELEQ